MKKALLLLCVSFGLIARAFAITADPPPEVNISGLRQSQNDLYCFEFGNTLRIEMFAKTERQFAPTNRIYERWTENGAVVLVHNYERKDAIVLRDEYYLRNKDWSRFNLIKDEEYTAYQEAVLAHDHLWRRFKPVACPKSSTPDSNAP